MTSTFGNKFLDMKKSALYFKSVYWVVSAGIAALALFLIMLGFSILKSTFGTLEELLNSGVSADDAGFIGSGIGVLIMTVIGIFLMVGGIKTLFALRTKTKK